MVLGTEVGLSPGDFVLYADPARPPQKDGGAPSQFSVHFYCGQTAGCLKMPLGMEVGLSSRDFVLDGHSVPLPKRGGASQFSAYVYSGRRVHGSRCHLVRGRPRPSGLCVRWGPSAPPQEGCGAPSPIFGPFLYMYCIVTKRLHGSR